MLEFRTPFIATVESLSRNQAALMLTGASMALRPVPLSCLLSDDTAICYGAVGSSCPTTGTVLVGTKSVIITQIPASANVIQLGTVFFTVLFLTFTKCRSYNVSCKLRFKIVDGEYLDLDLKKKID
ncbi:hypothetical protein CHS0354_006403 [Potamilus streckersoni]|uniref:Uncharacterized protein n=1 Tax=Potamilus streckersoni TaxID=2493646 RepID=A0AAE0W8J7_9BIVA|nr:hypothetical protein CHS0354_006403 [Potamilus streckersoni]